MKHSLEEWGFDFLKQNFVHVDLTSENKQKDWQPKKNVKSKMCTS